MKTVLYGVVLLSSFASAQIEYHDSIWTDVHSKVDTEFIDIPAYHIDPDELSNSYYGGNMLNNLRVHDCARLDLKDFLKLLADSSVCASTLVKVDDKRFYLRDYAMHVGDRSKVVVSCMFEHDDEGGIELIRISTNP